MIMRASYPLRTDWLRAFSKLATAVYGTTAFGGSYSRGTIWEITP